MIVIMIMTDDWLIDWVRVVSLINNASAVTSYFVSLNSWHNIQGGPKNWHHLLYTLNLPNINRFSKLVYCQNQEKICNSTITKDPPRLKCVTTLPCEMSSVCRSISLIAPLVSGVAGLSASSSSKVDTLNIWYKNCRMWWLLQTITETIYTLFPVANFLICDVTEVVLFSIVAFKTLWHFTR